MAGGAVGGGTAGGVGMHQHFGTGGPVAHEHGCDVGSGVAEGALIAATTGGGSGGGASCCEVGAGACTGPACGTGACYGEQAGAGSMTFVGDGGGDWTTETTYKYVGAGKGNLTVTVPMKRNFMPCVGLAALIAGVIVVLLLMTNSTPSSTIKSVAQRTTPAPVTKTKECLFWGDPHVVTFDGARPSFYGDGEYWIVKHPEVQIQGRYHGTKYTFGLAAMQKVAVGGTFIGKHIVQVEPMEEAFGGAIRVDGQPVLKEYGTYSIGGVTLTYDGIGELVDNAASKWTKNIVHMALPRGISLTVYRWGNYLDLRIQMQPLPGGQDGSCGNFNGDATDDTTQAIFERIGARIGQGEMLFTQRAPIEFTKQMEEMLRNDCTADDLIASQQKCQKELPQAASTMMMNSCIYDQCFGKNEHALRSAEVYSTAEERAALGIVG